MAWSLFLLAAALLVGTGQAQVCCEFDTSDICYWEPSTNPRLYSSYVWQWSGAGTGADLTNITDFDLAHHPNYMYLQDRELRGYANASVVSDTFSLYHNDHISIDIYRYIVYYDGGARPVVYFHDHKYQTVLALDIEWDPGWVTNEWVCGDALTCCLDYPCTGNLEITGILYDPAELMAFTNLDIANGCTNPVTPTCCGFDTSCSGWPTIGLGWYDDVKATPNWSVTKKGIVSYSSDYVWSQNINAAVLKSATFSGVNTASTFSFAYYADVTGSATLSVAFVSTTSGISYHLNTYGDNGATAFEYYNIDCSDKLCCSSTGVDCTGYLQFSTYYPSGEALFAIDNIETDNGCGNPTCCTFSTASFCGWSDLSTTYLWKWSGIESPNSAYFKYPFAPISGDYAWLQVAPSAQAKPNSILASQTFNNVDNSYYFSISYYVELNPEQSTNSLYIYFVEQGSATRTVLASLYDTNGVWSTQSFPCSFSAPTPTVCCPTGLCNGHLELDVSAANGVLFYAIDNLEVNGHCI